MGPILSVVVKWQCVFSTYVYTGRQKYYWLRAWYMNSNSHLSGSSSFGVTFKVKGFKDASVRPTETLRRFMVCSRKGV